MSKRREFRPSGIDVLEDRVVLSTVHVSAVQFNPALGTVQAQNQAYVQSLYTFVGRTANPGGVAFHANQLSNGNSSRYQMAHTFLNTSESANSATTGLYQRLLGRTPTQAELNSYGGSRSLVNEVSQILGSNEFYARSGGTNQGYITAVYRYAFGRTPDAGAQAWVNALNNGASRQQVALQILKSPEGSAALVSQAYATVLNRAPDSGSQSYTNYLNNGGSYENVVASLLASQEYYNGVQRGGRLAFA